MTDKPIIFSAPMVRAVIEGRKTQTRRVLKPQPDTISDPSGLGRWGTVNRYGYWRPAAEIRPVQPGDRLWVKEAIRPQLLRNILTGDELPNVWAAAYDADGEDVVDEDGFNLLPWWKKGGKLSPIFMPRWASRLTLTVTDVRVQRVQDISEEDAMAEGIERLKSGRGFYDPTVAKAAVHFGEWTSTAIQGFSRLWNAIHGPAAWDRNDWVAAYTFTVQRGNIDGGQV